MTPPNPSLSAANIVVSAIFALKASRNPEYFRLRRGSEALHAMFEPTFPQTRQALSAAGHRVRDENLACALLLLPHVGQGKASLGQALGDKKHPYSALRFQQLVTAEGPEELFTHVHRAIRFVEGQVSPFSIADLALNWTEGYADVLRKRLVADYHSVKLTAA